MRAESNKQAKAASLAFTRPSNALLDNPPTRIGIYQAMLSAVDSSNQAGIRDAIPTREPRKRFGFEDTHDLSIVLYIIVYRIILQEVSAAVWRLVFEISW